MRSLVKVLVSDK